MKSISPEDVSRIEVFGGDSGDIFYIDDPNTITEIVDNIKGLSLKKNKISLFYSGALFNLNFLNADDVSIYTITINDRKTIRKDPFFYNDSSGSICFDLLMDLESTAVRKQKKAPSIEGLSFIFFSESFRIQPTPQHKGCQYIHKTNRIDLFQ